MRSLIQSLTPHNGYIYWPRVGSIFALYVVLMVSAVGVFVSHESSRKLVRQPVTNAASDVKTRSIAQVAVPVRQVAAND